MKTKLELKQIAQRALKNEYGFKPPIKDIILLESYGNGTYILFEVNNKEYSFNSHLNSIDNSVWIGLGTIKKKG